MSVVIVGRFPPPLDGQTVATERLAGLLSAQAPVTRISVSAPESGVASEVRLRPERVLHYLGMRGRLRKALAAHPGALVLWPAISPAPLGHARDWLTVLPAFSKNQQVYGVVHRGDFHRLFEHSATRRAARAMVKRLEGIVFLSTSLAERCARWVPEPKRLVIPNTILDDLILSEEEVAEKQARRGGRERLRLLFLSNMIPSKGYADVLAATRLLRERGCAVEARFVGRWPSEEAEQAFHADRAAAGLDEVVEVLGPIGDRARLKALHAWADVFLLPTSYPTEAQPLTIIEAMNAGTPVVTTRHAGIPEMLSENEGAFVPPGDPEAIARAVERFRDEAHWQTASAAARARFVAAFSPEAVADQWYALVRAR